VRRIALVLPKDWLGSGLRLLCVPDRRLTYNIYDQEKLWQQLRTTANVVAVAPMLPVVTTHQQSFLEVPAVAGPAANATETGECSAAPIRIPAVAAAAAQAVDLEDPLGNNVATVCVASAQAAATIASTSTGLVSVPVTAMPTNVEAGTEEASPEAKVGVPTVKVLAEVPELKAAEAVDAPLLVVLKAEEETKATDLEDDRQVVLSRGVHHQSINRFVLVSLF
jgi:hypothetical protein